MIQWILTIALLMHDAHGYTRPMPQRVAEAIASVAPDRETAALLVVFAFRESTYRDDVRGDSGKSCGLFQTPCVVTPLRDARKQVEVAMGIFKRSAIACPEHPLAIYGTGRCIRWGESRAADVRRLLAVE